jgi:hypothetical protein
MHTEVAEQGQYYRIMLAAYLHNMWGQISKGWDESDFMFACKQG